MRVGNEINPGILLPHGGLKENPGQLVEFLNMGYDAVKECCPDCKVITHIADRINLTGASLFWIISLKRAAKRMFLGFRIIRTGLKWSRARSFY